MTAGTHVLRTDYLDGGINVESLILTLVEAAAVPEPEPEPAAADLGTGGGDPADVPVPAAPAPVAAAPAPVSAPQTADPITLIALGSIISAAGLIIAKKRK